VLIHGGSITEYRTPGSGKHMAVLWKFRLEAGLHLRIKFTTTLWSWLIILARRAG
jgi:hypothetical protein